MDGHESEGVASEATAVYNERWGNLSELKKEGIWRKQKEGGMELSLLVQCAG